MKLPILVATILLTTSSLGALAIELNKYEETQSVSPQADQLYKVPDHKAGKENKATVDTGKTDHKAGSSHKSGYPPYVRFYRGYGHGFWRHGHFVPYHRHY